MAVTNILLDTNGYTAFKQGQTGAIDIIQRANRIALNSTVLGELMAGFAVGTRESKNRAGTSLHYANVYRMLRSKGNPIPTNDMWIAATALQYGYALFSYDYHFRFIDGLLVGTNSEELLLL